jgi:hypothetical protein
MKSKNNHLFLRNYLIFGFVYTLLNFAFFSLAYLKLPITDFTLSFAIFFGAIVRIASLVLFIWSIVVIFKLRKNKYSILTFLIPVVIITEDIMGFLISLIMIYFSEGLNITYEKITPFLLTFQNLVGIITLSLIAYSFYTYFMENK